MSDGANARPDLFRGTERFELIRRIGDGGMGVVYEAYDRRRGATVALKTLLRASANAIYRFKKEFRSLAGLSHTNLVTLYELHSAQDTWFFTMELLTGVPFLAYVRPGAVSEQITEELTRPTVAVLAEELALAKRSGPDDTLSEGAEPPSITAPLDEARLRLALRQLAEGLHALHEAGKLHRDIKPSNVMITGSGRVVLLDFGLATDMDEDSMAWSHAGVVGTVGYMSPEITTGAAPSPAADWYSVGVMLYQALSGRLPYAGTPYQIMMKKQAEAPVPLSEVAPGAARDLVTLANALLLSLPKDRPTGREVLKALGAEPAPLGTPVFVRAAPDHSPALVGREEHLAALEAALGDAKAGSTVVAHVSGEPGMGKTALVRTFLEKVESEGRAIVLAGRCFEHELLPYKALDQLVDALARWLRRLSQAEQQAVLPPDVAALARIFPVLNRVDPIQQRSMKDEPSPDPAEERRRAFSAFRQLLQLLARKRPVLLFVDDLHFGDADSAALLSAVLAPPDAPPLLLIGAYPTRDRDEIELLRKLRSPDPPGAFELREIRVGALSQVASEQLARAVLASGGVDASVDEEDRRARLRTTDPAFPPPEVRARSATIAAEAEGSPLFVYELALAARQELGSNPSGESRQPTLDEVLQKRFEHLPKGARRLLEILVIAERPLSRAVAQHAAGLEAKDSQAIALLASQHLIHVRRRNEKEELECEHVRVSDAVLELLAPKDRAERHAQLAEAMRAAGAPAASILPHLTAAGAGAKETATLAEEAIRSSERVLAFAGAAEISKEVGELELDRAQRYRLKAARAGALFRDGRSEAAEIYLDAAKLAPDPAGEQEMKRRAAEVYLKSGRIEQGLAVLRPLLRSHGIEMPRNVDEALAMLRIERSRLLVRGLETQEIPAKDRDPALLAEADVCWTAGVGLTMVDVVAAAIFTTRYLRLALDAGDPNRLARGLAMELTFLTSEARSVDTRIHRVLETLRSEAKRLDAPYVRGFAALGAGLAALHEGEWSQTVRCVENAEAIFVRRCTGVDWELTTARTLGIWALGYQGRFAGLSERLARLIEDARQRGDLYTATILSMSGPASISWLAAGEPESALRQLEDAKKSSASAGYALAHYWELCTRAQIDLYKGDARSAWRRVTQRWPAIEQSLVTRVQVIRAEANYLRARTALASAVGSSSPRPLYAAARANANALLGEGPRWCTGLGRLLLAQIDRGLGLKGEAEECYAEAASAFASAGMEAHAAVARWRLGQMLGRAGRVTLVEANQALLERGIKDPPRFVALLAPGAEN